MTGNTLQPEVLKTFHEGLHVMQWKTRQHGRSVRVAHHFDRVHTTPVTARYMLEHIKGLYGRDEINRRVRQFHRIRISHITYYCCDFLSQVTCTFLIFLESPKMKFEFFEMLCYCLFFIFNYCLGQKWIANTYQGR